MLKVKMFLGNPCQECTYVLSDETGEAVIVDCGAFYEKERERLLNYINDNDLRPVRLLLTHAHHDHVYGNDLIHMHYGLLPEVHKDDQPLMTKVLLRRIEEIYGTLYPYSVPMPEHYLNNDEEIHFGNHVLRVIHTPGHSPGSVVYYCEAEKIALTGDTLMKRYVGSTELIGSDPMAMRLSLDLILSRLPDDTVIYPGHDGKSTIGDVKKKNWRMQQFLSLYPIG